MAKIQAGRTPQGVKELPFWEKTPQQKQPGMDHRTTVKNKAPQQKREIADKEREIQRQTGTPFQMAMTQDAAPNPS